MDILFAFAIVTAILILVWSVWFIVRLIQYISSGEYEIDQRLREICK
jgi:hypothetical protein